MVRTIFNQINLLILLSCASLVLTHNQTVHVILIAGESNAIGYNSDGHTAEDVSHPNILQTSCCHNGKEDWDTCRLIKGQDPLHHICDSSYVNSENVGFGMSFARLYRHYLPADDYILLVPAGIPDSGFADGLWTPYTGFGFLKAVARLRTSMKLASKMFPKHTTSFHSVLWHQGESDADLNVSVRDFLTRDLIPFVSAWRNESFIPETSQNVTFVAGNLLPSWSENQSERERMKVVVALQILNQFMPRTMVVPSVGLIGNPSEKPEPIHFTAKSQRLFGLRYFTAWAMSFLNTKVTP